MRKHILLFLGIVCSFCVKAQSLPSEAIYHPHRILVQFKDSSPYFPAMRSGIEIRTPILKATAEMPSIPAVEFLRHAGIEKIGPLKSNATVNPLPGGIERIYICETDRQTDLIATMEFLMQSGHFEYVEHDYIGHGGGVLCNETDAIPTSGSLIPNDPVFGNQWGLRNTGQPIGGFAGMAGADINIVPAWDITTGAPDILMAVLDSGVPANAFEFGTRMRQGYDYVNNDNAPVDDHGHGTNVTSIAVATGNNSTAMAGVNWQCDIVHFKILDSQNSGQYSWWASAMVAAADSGAHVINISAGGSGASTTLHNAVKYAAARGAMITACMMNTNSQVPFHPAVYPEVIAVGATNNRNQRAAPFCFSATSGSNFGNHIDFVAPGELITGLNYLNPVQTNMWCGTSQAAPLVAGVISLMLSIQPGLTFQEVYEILKLTARDQIGDVQDVPGWDRFYGWGLIDADAAVRYVDMLSSAQERLRGVHDVPALLCQPNPFRQSTTFHITLPGSAFVTLRIHDALGNTVDQLVSAILSAGSHVIPWTPGAIAPGVYFCHMQVGNQMFTTRMMMME